MLTLLLTWMKCSFFYVYFINSAAVSQKKDYLNRGIYFFL